MTRTILVIAITAASMSPGPAPLWAQDIAQSVPQETQPPPATAPSAPPPAPPRDPTQRLRLSVHGTLRFLGGYEFYDGGRGDSDVGIAAGVRLEIPITPHFALGPFLTAGSLKDRNARDRYNVVGAGVALEAHLYLPLEPPGLGLDLHAGVPVGMTAFIYPEGGGAVVDVGLTLGAVLGARLFVTQSLGILVEIGFTHDELFATNESDPAYRQTQAIANIGMTFAF